MKNDSNENKKPKAKSKAKRKPSEDPRLMPIATGMVRKRDDPEKSKLGHHHPLHRKPIMWTQEAIEDLADDMMAYFKKNKQAMTFTQWLTDSPKASKLSNQRVSEFKHQNAYFAHCAEQVHRICELRTIDQLFNGNTIAAKFMLARKYGYVEKQIVEQTTTIKSFADTIKNIGTTEYRIVDENEEEDA